MPQAVVSSERVSSPSSPVSHGGRGDGLLIHSSYTTGWGTIEAGRNFRLPSTPHNRGDSQCNAATSMLPTRHHRQANIPKLLR